MSVFKKFFGNIIPNKKPQDDSVTVSIQSLAVTTTSLKWNTTAVPVLMRTSWSAQAFELHVISLVIRLLFIALLELVTLFDITLCFLLMKAASKVNVIVSGRVCKTSVRLTVSGEG